MNDGNSSTRLWQEELHEIIFEADTKAGKAFDVVLIVSILLSVATVMLDTVEAIEVDYGIWLYRAEWLFTLIFTCEYILRLYSLGQPLKYALSFFGLVDMLSIIPSYLSLFLPGTQYLLVIRLLRVLRVFRVLKLVQYLKEAQLLAGALQASGRKIFVFLFTVSTLVVIFGALMYLVEGREHGFTSIPHSIYWAIVTLTTVGYGDVAPQTPLGQALASVIMILGYSIIAVPTGIVSAEISNSMRSEQISTQCCPECSAEGHAPDAKYCKFCGEGL
jgi:voltage-gated potassium channel